MTHHDAIPRMLSGITDILERYDLFIIDQYGVLHDGQAAYPGAADAVARLAGCGKHVVLLTNSGRSAAYNIERIRRMGIPTDCVHAVVTSGDVARAWLRERYTDGARCLALTSAGNTADAIDAGLTIVEAVDDAELVLVTGLPIPAQAATQAHFAALLDAAAARDLPMVCCNPDEQAVIGSEVVVGAGALAAWYRHRGGRVRYFGKPYPEVFTAALACAPQVGAERALMLGDMPRTDLAGAEAAGIASLFVLGGVHASSTLGADAERNAGELVRRAGTRADWCIPQLRWQA